VDDVVIFKRLIQIHVSSW